MSTLDDLEAREAIEAAFAPIVRERLVLGVRIRLELEDVDFVSTLPCEGEDAPDALVVRKLTRVNRLNDVRSAAMGMLKSAHDELSQRAAR